MADLPFLKSHKNKKKCLIPLDKSPNLCYNKYVPNEEQQKIQGCDQRKKVGSYYGKQENCGRNV